MRPTPILRTFLGLVLAACSVHAGCKGGDGALQVVSYPRGVLVIDGRRTSERTPITRRRIASGSHEISIVAEGVRFVPQRITVREGRTSHLYFRARDPDRDVAPDEICRSGRSDHCIARIEASLRSGDRTTARRLASIGLARDEHEGYSIMYRQIIRQLGGDAGPDPTPDE